MTDSVLNKLLSLNGAITIQWSTVVNNISWLNLKFITAYISAIIKNWKQPQNQGNCFILPVKECTTRTIKKNNKQGYWHWQLVNNICNKTGNFCKLQALLHQEMSFVMAREAHKIKMASQEICRSSGWLQVLLNIVFRFTENISQDCFTHSWFRQTPFNWAKENTLKPPMY